MLDKQHQQRTVNSLDALEVRLRTIRRLIDASAECPDILKELAAAEAAFQRVSQSVLKFHVTRCVPEGVGNGHSGPSKGLQELVDIFDRFA